VTGKEFNREEFWKEWDVALAKVEETLGEKYRKALARWFKAEGERYATYFGGIA